MKNVVIVGDPEFVSTTQSFISNNISYDCKSEIFTDANNALARLCTNGFDLLLSKVNLNDNSISGITLAKMVSPLGKHTILMSDKPFIDGMWLKLIYSRLDNVICLGRNSSNVEIRWHINRCLSFDHIHPVDFFDTVMAK